VTFRDFVPNTVAGPRRLSTGFPCTETRKLSIAVHYTLREREKAKKAENRLKN
jgi:hypothetical protein